MFRLKGMIMNSSLEFDPLFPLDRDGFKIAYRLYRSSISASAKNPSLWTRKPYFASTAHPYITYAVYYAYHSQRASTAYLHPGYNPPDFSVFGQIGRLIQ